MGVSVWGGWVQEEWGGEDGGICDVEGCAEGVRDGRGGGGGGGAGPEKKLVDVVDVQPPIGDQVVLPQDMRFLLDVVDGEEVEGEIAAVIQQRPLIGRDVGIDSQALIALNLLQLPLEALDAGL